MILNVIDSFKRQLESIDHPIHGNLELDTADWQRYDCPTSSKGNKNVSYRAHTDGRPCIKVQCHKCHPEAITLKYDGELRYIAPSPHPAKAEEHAEKNTAALITMRSTWDNAQTCMSHHYFDRKCLSITEADGLRMDNRGRVLCPVRLITGDLVTTQSIPIKGKKLFFKGATLSKGFHVFGSIEGHYELFFAEGIATAATIRDASNHPVICTYGKRFDTIAPLIAEKYPEMKLTYCCDLPSEEEKVTSATNARKAISLTGGTYTLPNFSTIPDSLKPEIQRTDFNDLFVLLLAKGLERTAALDIVRQQLAIKIDEDIMTKNEKEKQPKQSEILLDLIDSDNGFDFFQDEHETAFCRYPSRPGIYENRRICERKFKSYLSRLYRQHTGKSIGEPSLKEALIELEGRALHEKSSRKERVYIRCAEKDGKIYLDLCNPDWQAVEISAEGWKILNSSAVPVRFERPGHAAPLPDPTVVSIGDIDKLWEIVNIPEQGRLLVLAYILESFRCGTAFPVLLLLGLQGSGKSVTQNGIRSLIDPSASNLRIAPRKPDDIVVEAASNWLVSYNNISALSDEMHDDFCCISTGSGFSTRRFYTNLEQIIVNIARPVIMNGIYNFIRRPDLLDRAIIIELPSIDDKQRKTDSDLQSMLNESLPIIFRGLLNLMVKVLQILPTIHKTNMLRLADFSLLGTAVERALGKPDGTFMKEYRKNHSDAREGSLESSPVIMALLDFVEINHDGWRGTPTELLAELTTLKNPSPHLNWPKTGQKMGAELRRYDAVLRQNDVAIIHEKNESGKKNKRGNVIRVYKDDTPSPDSEKKSTKSTPPTSFEEEPAVNAASKEFLGVDFSVDTPADISERASHADQDVHSEPSHASGFSRDDHMQVHAEVHPDVHSLIMPSMPHEYRAGRESGDLDKLKSGHGGLQNPACTVPDNDGDSALLI